MIVTSAPWRPGVAARIRCVGRTGTDEMFPVHVPVDVRHRLRGKGFQRDLRGILRPGEQEPVPWQGIEDPDIPPGLRRQIDAPVVVHADRDARRTLPGGTRGRTGTPLRGLAEEGVEPFGESRQPVPPGGARPVFPGEPPRELHREPVMVAVPAVKRACPLRGVGADEEFPAHVSALRPRHHPREAAHLRGNHPGRRRRGDRGGVPVEPLHHLPQDRGGGERPGGAVSRLSVEISRPHPDGVIGGVPHDPAVPISRARSGLDRHAERQVEIRGSAERRQPGGRVREDVGDDVRRLPRQEASRGPAGVRKEVP
jgi:hypothetical protein